MSDLDAAGVRKLKVAELRTELTKRGLDAKGNKPVLIERLVEALESPSTKAEEQAEQAPEEIKEPEAEDAGKEEVTEAAAIAEDHKHQDDVTESATEENESDTVPDAKTTEEETPGNGTDSIEKAEPMETNEEPEKIEEKKSEGEDMCNLVCCIYTITPCFRLCPGVRFTKILTSHHRSERPKSARIKVNKRPTRSR